MMARFVSGSALALCCAVAANADTVQMKYVGVGAGMNVRIVHNGSATNVFAGQIRHQFSNGVGLGAQFSGEIMTFCSEITQHATSTLTTYNVIDPSDVSLPPIGFERAGVLQNLYSYAQDQQAMIGQNANYAAAFQLAVWEIVYDFSSIEGMSSLSIVDGNFEAMNTNLTELSAAVQNYLTEFFNAALTQVPSYTLYGLQNDHAQDQLIAVPMGAVIPLPTAGLMGLTGLGVLAARRRR